MLLVENIPLALSRSLSLSHSLFLPLKYIPSSQKMTMRLTRSDVGFPDFQNYKNYGYQYRRYMKKAP